MNSDDLATRADELHGTEPARAATAPEFCFSWCPVAGCVSLCGAESVRPAAGAQRSEHRQRGALASITTPFIPKLGICDQNAPTWCMDE